jgi:SAM-dependent methyltransferase
MSIPTEPRSPMGAANRYFATDSHDAFERERLALLTQIADPITTRRLADLGVAPRWRCLDVGAGDGSVARWLAARVGPEGRVVATDLNPRFLAGHGLPNLEIRRHDILEDELETARYDLVHCRFLLMHLADPLRALDRMAAAVRPGGWLIVEDADSGSFGSADAGHSRSAEFDRRTRAVHLAVQAMEMIDSTFARRLCALVEGLGLREVGCDGATIIGRGGGPAARKLQMTFQLLRGPLVASGALTRSDFDELHETLHDPTFYFIHQTNFGAWGRRGG